MGPVEANYKDGCLAENRPVEQATPLAGDPHRYIDETPVFRCFYCPGCGTLIEAEVAIEGDPPLRDITLRLAAGVAE